MSLGRFNKIKTDRVSIQTDPDYSAYLTSLPESTRAYSRMRAVGTVAAVLAVLVAVTVWALIGRGMRGQTPMGAGSEDVASAIYNAVEADVLSDSNVKSADITVGRITKVDDSLYICSVNMDIHFHDEQNITYPLNQTNEYYHAIFPLYIECDKGIYTVSENQERKLSVIKKEGTGFEWELDDGMMDLIHELIGTYHVLAMPLFDEQAPMSDEDLLAFCTYIAQQKGITDLNQIAYDYFALETDFKSSSITGCEFLSFPKPEIISYITYDTVYGQWYIEITYAIEDEVRVLGFVYKGDGVVERFVFNKRDELFYDGSRGIGALTDKMLRADPFAPYEYSAEEVSRALDGEMSDILDEVLLPQSMGIAVPNINAQMIEPYDAVSVTSDPDCADIVADLTEKCEHGDSSYTEDQLANYTWYDYMYEVGMNYVWNADVYEAFAEKHPEVGDVRSSWTAGMMFRYEQLYKLKKGYRYYLDTFSEEQLLELKRRGVMPDDIPALIEKLKTAKKVLKASDEKLKQIIEESYKQKITDILGRW